YCHPHPWTVVRVCTAQEEHGDGRRLIRVRFTLRLTTYGRGLFWAGVAAGACTWSLGVPALVISAAAFGAGLWMWRRGTFQAASVVGVFDTVADQFRWITLVESKKMRRNLRVLRALKQVIRERLFPRLGRRITKGRD